MTPEQQEIERVLTVVAERVRGTRAHLDSLMGRALAEDPVLQARLFNDLLNELERANAEIQKARLTAIYRLRQDGYSYDRLAEVLNVSKSRVQQLVRAADLAAEKP